MGLRKGKQKSRDAVAHKPHDTQPRQFAPYISDPLPSEAMQHKRKQGKGSGRNTKGADLNRGERS
jgi:hypothetical protein